VPVPVSVLGVVAVPVSVVLVVAAAVVFAAGALVEFCVEDVPDVLLVLLLVVLFVVADVVLVVLVFVVDVPEFLAAAAAAAAASSAAFAAAASASALSFSSYADFSILLLSTVFLSIIMPVPTVAARPMKRTKINILETIPLFKLLFKTVPPNCYSIIYYSKLSTAFQINLFSCRLLTVDP